MTSQNGLNSDILVIAVSHCMMTWVSFVAVSILVVQISTKLKGTRYYDTCCYYQFLLTVHCLQVQMKSFSIIVPYQFEPTAYNGLPSYKQNADSTQIAASKNISY